MRSISLLAAGTLLLAGCSSLASRAEDRFEHKNYGQALSNYGALDPALMTPELTQHCETAAREFGKQKLDEAQKLLDAGSPDEAFDLFAKVFAARLPGSKDGFAWGIQENVWRAKQGMSDSVTLTWPKVLLADPIPENADLKQLWSAETRVEAEVARFEGHASLAAEDLLAKSRKRLADFFIARGKKYQAQQQWGAAYLQFMMASRYLGHFECTKTVDTETGKRWSILWNFKIDAAQGCSTDEIASLKTRLDSFPHDYGLDLHVVFAFEEAALKFEMTEHTEEYTAYVPEPYTDRELYWGSHVERREDTFTRGGNVWQASWNESVTNLTPSSREVTRSRMVPVTRTHIVKEPHAVVRLKGTVTVTAEGRTFTYPINLSPFAIVTSRNQADLDGTVAHPEMGAADSITVAKLRGDVHDGVIKELTGKLGDEIFKKRIADFESAGAAAAAKGDLVEADGDYALAFLSVVPTWCPDFGPFPFPAGASKWIADRYGVPTDQFENLIKGTWPASEAPRTEGEAPARSPLLPPPELDPGAAKGE